jgi:hypothetical protein
VKEKDEPLTQNINKSKQKDSKSTSNQVWVISDLI